MATAWGNSKPRSPGGDRYGCARPGRPEAAAAVGKQTTSVYIEDGHAEDEYAAGTRRKPVGNFEAYTGWLPTPVETDGLRSAVTDEEARGGQIYKKTARRILPGAGQQLQKNGPVWN